MNRWVGSLADLQREGSRVVDVDGRSVVVICVGEQVFAVSNRCPHMGAPMCAGSLGGTLVSSDPHEFVYGLDAQVLRCPWHGWEFDLTTGRSLLEPRRYGLRVFEVSCTDGQVVLHTPDRRPVPDPEAGDPVP